jgi:alkanesulfonate monooxygenase SsuD/methylene tetrahydromethanopterin reductase-like flavin-dependent oxidoreductase (luciferase family)
MEHLDAYTFSLLFDMRAPDFGPPASELYRAAIEMSAWADKRGFRDVNLLEHHASNDGYLPSPLVLGAGIAAATENLGIRTNVALLPLYHPLRFAEDAAVLDLISGGRTLFTVGAGYRVEEYEQFGVDIKKRPSLMEQALQAVKQAWTGEPFEFRGKTVRILPRPAQDPCPPIYLGGTAPATAVRAARFADGYEPLGPPELYDLYVAECEKLGKSAPPQPDNRYRMVLFFHIAEDPEKAWATIGRHAMHEMNEYGRWAATNSASPYSEISNPDDLRAPGMYEVVTPDDAVAAITERRGALFKPLMGGMPPALGWESLELFESKVLPRLGE